MDGDACVRVWTRPLQVMLQQKKIKARRKKRKELFGGQMCFMGLLLLAVSGLSSLTENSGEFRFRICQECVFVKAEGGNGKFCGRIILALEAVLVENRTRNIALKGKHVKGNVQIHTLITVQ